MSSIWREPWQAEVLDCMPYSVLRPICGIAAVPATHPKEEQLSCILRIAGETLDVDSLLLHSPLLVYRTWRKGEPRNLKNKCHTDSGAVFIVSEADFDDFAGQLADASAFLNANAPALATLASFAGVQHACLDFAVAFKEGLVLQTSYLPAAFLQAAAVAGIGIAISHYACSEDDA